MNAPSFDVSSAHRYFASQCYNQAWKLIDKPDRTPAEDEQMIRLSQASHWHWTQREDYTPEKASIGHWQLARIYALLGQAENASRYGRLCLAASEMDGVGAFYRGYACEALARAAAVAGNREQMEAHLAAARVFADAVTEGDERQQLLDDLATIRLAR